MPEQRAEISELVKQNFKDERLRRLVDHQTAIGLEKYGQLLHQNVKTPDRKFAHAAQELVDLSQYIEWIGTEVFSETQLRYLRSLTALIGIELTNAFREVPFETMIHKEGKHEKQETA